MVGDVDLGGGDSQGGYRTQVRAGTGTLWVGDNSSERGGRAGRGGSNTTAARQGVDVSDGASPLPTTARPTRQPRVPLVPPGHRDNVSAKPAVDPTALKGVVTPPGLPPQPPYMGIPAPVLGMEGPVSRNDQDAEVVGVGVGDVPTVFVAEGLSSLQFETRTQGEMGADSGHTMVGGGGGERNRQEVIGPSVPVGPGILDALQTPHETELPGLAGAISVGGVEGAPGGLPLSVFDPNGELVSGAADTSERAGALSAGLLPASLVAPTNQKSSVPPGFEGVAGGLGNAGLLTASTLTANNNNTGGSNNNPIPESLLGIVMAGLGSADENLCTFCCATMNPNAASCAVCGTPTPAPVFVSAEVGDAPAARSENDPGNGQTGVSMENGGVAGTTGGAGTGIGAAGLPAGVLAVDNLAEVGLL